MKTPEETLAAMRALGKTGAQFARIPSVESRIAELEKRIEALEEWRYNT